MIIGGSRQVNQFCLGTPHSKGGSARHWLAILFLIVSSAASAQPPVPEIPFDSVPHFLKLPPNLYIGEPAGVASRQ
jgi:hypothetical protein